MMLQTTSFLVQTQKQTMDTVYMTEEKNLFVN